MEGPLTADKAPATAADLAAQFDVTRPELVEESVLREVYQALREHMPVKRVEPAGRYAGDRTWWFVSRYEDVRRVFQDDDTFTSEDNTAGGVPGPIDTSPIALEEVDPYVVATNSQKIPQALDPPQFSPYRGLLNPLFSPGQAKKTEWITREIADDLLAKLKEPRQRRGPSRAGQTASGDRHLPNSRASRDRVGAVGHHHPQYLRATQRRPH
jgi:cytochrome P450